MKKPNRKNFALALLCSAVLFTAACSPNGSPSEDITSIPVVHAFTLEDVEFDVGKSWVDSTQTVQENSRLLLSDSGDSIMVQVSDITDYDGGFEEWAQAVKDNMFAEDSQREIIAEGDVEQSGHRGKSWIYSDSSGLGHVLRVIDIGEENGLILLGTTDSDLNEIENNIESIDFSVGEAKS